MPDKNDGDNAAAPMRVDAAPMAEAPAKQPETEAERRKRRLDAAEKESDDDRSKRRAGELGVHLTAHMENVAASHAKYPNAPLHFERGREYTVAEMTDWNARRNDIDMANKAYYRAVMLTFAEHQAEDAHIVRVRAVKNAA
jgi:hypothetical protein